MKNLGFSVMRWCAHAQSEMKAIVTPKNAIVWTQNILSVSLCGQKTFVPFSHLKFRFQIYPA